MIPPLKLHCLVPFLYDEDRASHLKELANLIEKHNNEEKQAPLREPDLPFVITLGENMPTPVPMG